jgi:hypothetical protein
VLDDDDGAPFGFRDGERVGFGRGLGVDLWFGTLRERDQSFRYSLSRLVWDRLTGISVLLASFIRRI